jgi:hypothetical protein
MQNRQGSMQNRQKVFPDLAAASAPGTISLLRRGGSAGQAFAERGGLGEDSQFREILRTPRHPGSGGQVLLPGSDAAIKILTNHSRNEVKTALL